MAVRGAGAQPGDELPVPVVRRPARLSVAQRHRYARAGRHRRRRLPPDHRRPRAALVPRRRRLPDLPRPVRPLRGRQRPAAAAVGGTGRLGRPGHRPGPEHPVAGVRGRPGRHHRPTRPRGVAGRGHRLPDAGVPRRVQPPLQRVQLRRGRPAARRRQGAAAPGPGGARPGLAIDRRPHHQPLRRHPPVVPHRAGRPGQPGAGVLLLRRRRPLHRLARPRDACPSSGSPRRSCAAASSTGRTRWPPAGCARRTPWTAGASTWPT